MALETKRRGWLTACGIEAGVNVATINKQNSIPLWFSVMTCAGTLGLQFRRGIAGLVIIEPVVDQKQPLISSNGFPKLRASWLTH